MPRVRQNPVMCPEDSLGQELRHSAPRTQSRHSTGQRDRTTEQPSKEEDPWWVGPPLAEKLAQPAPGSRIRFQKHSASPPAENTCCRVNLAL